MKTNATTKQPQIIFIRHCSHHHSRHHHSLTILELPQKHLQYHDIPFTQLACSTIPPLTTILIITSAIIKRHHSNNHDMTQPLPSPYLSQTPPTTIPPPTATITTTIATVPATLFIIREARAE